MPHYRISQLADRVGVPATTLRFYDKVGLLTAGRTPAGYRVYGDADAERVRFIAAARQLGLPLSQIRELLVAWDGGTCRAVRDELQPMVGAQITAADQRIAELGTFRDRLSAVLGHLRDLPAREGPCDQDCELQGSPAAAAEPIACSLTAGQYAERIERWRRLVLAAERETLPGGGMKLRVPVASAGELADLVVAEHECCPFFTFHLTLSGRYAELEAHGPKEAEPLITALFGAPHPTPQSRGQGAAPAGGTVDRIPSQPMAAARNSKAAPRR